MSPEVTVSDAEAKSNDIEIRDGGANCSNRPDTLWYLRFVEAGSNAEGSNGM
jgi:hypothetical protein